ncbi:MAG: PorT family protein, partial [Verrucomicrobia bacterium]|nr:PorT family protein [Cytophagales bacterium]
ARKNQVSTEGALTTENIDFSVEYGFGFDLYYAFFKLSPELRFSHGVSNLLIADSGNIYNRNLSRLTTHNVSFILYFDGY